LSAASGSDAPQRGDKWHLDEVVITLAGRKHWL
jgi:putative transposase